MITLFVDAARNVTSGFSAAGAVILIEKKQYQIKSPIFKTNDNHQAEFMALSWALRHLPSSDSIIKIYSDSKIMTDALEKKYAKHYQPFVDKLCLLLQSYNLVLIQWIPEKENRGAHNLALQALKKDHTTY